jgi:hypothetical protein
MEERILELEQRLAAAERRATATERRFRRCTAGTLGAAVLIGGLAFWQGSAVAQQAGKAKPLKVTKVTAPLQVVDQSGAILLMVESARPGPRLQLYGSTGRPIAELAMNMQGGGQFTTYDRTGKVSFTKPDPPKKK